MNLSESLIFIVLLVLLFGTSLQITEMEKKLVCPPGFTYFDDGNFCLDGLHKTTMTFRLYAEHCKKLVKNYTDWGGLVTLTTFQAYESLVNHVSVSDDCYYMWLGATDQDQEGHWRWIRNGQSLEYGMKGRTLPWMSGQPNDKSSPGERPQDCLTLNQDFRMNDYECESRLCSVCSVYEANLCQKSNGDCQQLCIVTGPHTRTCTCRAGFRLTEMFFCDDVDECGEFPNGNCQQICNNYRGGRECFCRNGYEKVNDTHCELTHPCEIRNGGCSHVCRTGRKDGIGKSSWCECLEGYELVNGTSCGNPNFGKTKRKGKFLLLAVFSVTCSLVVMFGTFARHSSVDPEENLSDGFNLEVTGNSSIRFHHENSAKTADSTTVEDYEEIYANDIVVH